MADNFDPETAVTVGRIIAPHGIRGEVKVEPLTDFPDADSFVPSRYLDPRREDLANPWTYIPFGAGKHRCMGASFATMQLKAIFSVLLQGWMFRLSQPKETYRNDHSKMVVQLEQPCRARYEVRA